MAGNKMNYWIKRITYLKLFQTLKGFPGSSGQMGFVGDDGSPVSTNS